MKRIIALLAIVVLSWQAHAGSVTINNTTGTTFTGTFHPYISTWPSGTLVSDWFTPGTVAPGTLFYPTVEAFRLAWGGPTSVPGTGFYLWGIQFSPTSSGCLWSGQIGSNITFTCTPSFTVRMTADASGNTTILIY